MGLTGNLSDMAVADLIQLNCLDQKTTRLKIEHDDQLAEVYFANGETVHAALGDLKGEEVVYKILAWNDGTFSHENDVKSSTSSIQRSWSSLLLEGARRLDEQDNSPIQTNNQQIEQPEESKMAQKFDEILAELAGEITGYNASALVGIDGINVASNFKGKLDPDVVSAHMTMLLKLVDGSTEKLGAGNLEDNLTTTEKAYILMRFLPGKQYYLSINADRKTGNLGNMRLISKMYTDRLAKAMPH